MKKKFTEAQVQERIEKALQEERERQQLNERFRGFDQWLSETNNSIRDLRNEMERELYELKDRLDDLEHKKKEILKS